MEGLEDEQEVGLDVEPGADGAALPHGAEAAAGHDGAGGQREVQVAGDRQLGGDLPVEAQAGDGWVVGRRIEVRAVAAKREHELALVVAAEPRREREAAGQLAVAGQHRTTAESAGR